MNNKFKIKESLLVSDTVTSLTNRLGKELLFILKNKKAVIHKDRNIIFKKGIYNFNTEGILNVPYIKIKYYVYLFKDEEHYQYNTKYTTNIDNIDCGFCDYKNHTINLYLAMIDDEPSPTFYSTIQHEMNHFFQNDNGATKNENFYEKIIKLRKSGNVQEQWIAYALYLAFNTEIDSFTSQFYAYLKHKKPNTLSNKNYNDLDDKNNPYYEFNLAFEKVDNMNIDEDNLKAKLGITINQLYNILNNADKKLYNKIHKVWTKYISESFQEKIPFNHSRMMFLLECHNKNINEFDDDLY